MRKFRLVYVGLIALFAFFILWWAVQPGADEAERLNACDDLDGRRAVIEDQRERAGDNPRDARVLEEMEERLRADELRC